MGGYCCYFYFILYFVVYGVCFGGFFLICSLHFSLNLAILFIHSYEPLFIYKKNAITILLDYVLYCARRINMFTKGLKRIKEC